MDKRPQKRSPRKKYKIGHKVKINKKGHEWHGKVGTVLKSKARQTDYAIGIDGINQSQRFDEVDLEYPVLDKEQFTKGAKMKAPRKPRGRGR